MLQIYKNNKIDVAILKNINKFSYYRIFSGTLAFYSVVVLLLQLKGFNFLQIMILSSLENILVSILEVPMGIFADKFGRKKSIVIGLIALIFFLISYGIFSNYYFLLVCSLFFALSSTAISGADTALIYDYMAEKDLNEYYLEYASKESSTIHFLKSFILILSTFLLELNIIYPILLSILFTIISLYFVLMFKVENDSGINNSEKESENQESKKIFFEFLKNKDLRSLLIIRIILIIIISNVIYLSEVFLVSNGISIKYIGVIMFLYGMIASYGAKSAKIIEEKFSNTIFVITFLLLGIISIAMNFLSGYIVILTLGFIRFISAVINPIFSKKVNETITKSDRATLLSIVSLFVSFGMAITDPIIGLLADYRGVGFVYFVLGVLALFSALILRFEKNIFK